MGQVAVGRPLVVADRLGIPLLHHAEAAELALHAVEVAVVVGVAVGEPPTCHVVDDLHLLEHLHRERQACGPRAPRLPICEVELRRAGVGEPCLTSEIVFDSREQMGPTLGHQAHETQRARLISQEWR